MRKLRTPREVTFRRPQFCTTTSSCCDYTIYIPGGIHRVGGSTVSVDSTDSVSDNVGGNYEHWCNKLPFSLCPSSVASPWYTGKAYINLYEVEVWQLAVFGVRLRQLSGVPCCTEYPCPLLCSTLEGACSIPCRIHSRYHY